MGELQTRTHYLRITRLAEEPLRQRSLSIRSGIYSHDIAYKRPISSALFATTKSFQWSLNTSLDREKTGESVESFCWAKFQFPRKLQRRKVSTFERTFRDNEIAPVESKHVIGQRTIRRNHWTRFVW